MCVCAWEPWTTREVTQQASSTRKTRNTSFHHGYIQYCTYQICSTERFLISYHCIARYVLGVTCYVCVGGNCRSAVKKPRFRSWCLVVVCCCCFCSLKSSVRQRTHTTFTSVVLVEQHLVFGTVLKDIFLILILCFLLLSLRSVVFLWKLYRVVFILPYYNCNNFLYKTHVYLYIHIHFRCER